MKFTDNWSLLAAYKNLIKIIEENILPDPLFSLMIDIKSNFGTDVINYCDKRNMEQSIIPPSIFCCTQKYDRKYDRSLNHGSFMNTLADAWEKRTT